MLKALSRKKEATIQEVEVPQTYLVSNLAVGREICTEVDAMKNTRTPKRRPPQESWLAAAFMLKSERLLVWTSEGLGLETLAHLVNQCRFQQEDFKILRLRVLVAMAP